MKTIYKQLVEIITTINNGYISKHLEILVSKSNINIKFLKILKKNGFIFGFFIYKNHIKILLKTYNNNSKALSYNFQLFSIKNNTLFFRYNELLLLKKKMKSPFFLLFITNFGFLTLDELLKKKIGGKLLLKIIEN